MAAQGRSEGSGVPPRVGFFGGLGQPFRGARYVYVEHRALARFWLPPIVITLVALGLAGHYALELRDDLVNGLWQAPMGEGFVALAGRFFHGLLEWLAALLLFAVCSVLVVLLASVVAAPFNDALSEAVECIETGRSGPPFQISRLVRDLGRTVGLEAFKLALYLLVMVPLLLLSLALPVVGPVAYSVGGFLFTAAFFALDFTDYTASRRGRSVRERLGALSTHRREMFGFGMGVWLFMLVPLVNLFFMPAAVAGGTLLYLRLHPQ